MILLADMKPFIVSLMSCLLFPVQLESDNSCTMDESYDEEKCGSEGL